MARDEIQFKKGLIIGTFLAGYGTEAQCEAARTQWRWHDGFQCSACGGCRHQPIGTTLPTQQPEKIPAFRWVNTVLGNEKTAIAGTSQAVRPCHTKLNLAEFQHRFNRRATLRAMLDHLAFIAVRAKPRTYRYLKVSTQRGDQPNE